MSESKFSVDDILNEVKAMQSGKPNSINNIEKNESTFKSKFDEKIVKNEVKEDTPEEVKEEETEKAQEVKEEDKSKENPDFSKMTSNKFNNLVNNEPKDNGIVGGFKIRTDILGGNSNLEKPVETKPVDTKEQESVKAKKMTFSKPKKTIRNDDFVAESPIMKEIEHKVESQSDLSLEDFLNQAIPEHEPITKKERKLRNSKTHSSIDDLFKKTSENVSQDTVLFDKKTILDAAELKRDEAKVAVEEIPEIQKEREHKVVENIDNKDNGIFEIPEDSEIDEKDVIGFGGKSKKDAHKPEHVLSPHEINNNELNETVRFKINNKVIDLTKKKPKQQIKPNDIVEDKVQEIVAPEEIAYDDNSFKDVEFPTVDDKTGEFTSINKLIKEQEEKEYKNDFKFTYEEVDQPVEQIDNEISSNSKEHEAFAKKTKRSIKPRNVDYSGEVSNEEDVIDDYCTIDDAEAVQFDLDTNSKKLSSRLFFSVVGLIVSSIVTLLPSLDFSALNFISPESNANLFLILNAAVLAFVVIVNITSFIRGFVSLVTFKPDVDSALSFSILIAIVQSIIAFTFTDIVTANNVPIFTTAVIFGVVFNLLGKKSMIKRIRSNFRLVATTTVKQSGIVADDRMGELLEQDDFIGIPTVACSKSVINLHNYLYNSYCEDASDNCCKTLAPIGVLVTLATLVITYFTSNDIMSALGYAAAVSIVCVPATALLSSNLPIKNVCKKIREKGGLISGFNAVDEFSDVDCVTLNAEEVFPAGSVELLSLRAIGEVSIEDVILKSAALAITAGGPLADVFDKIIDGRRKMLAPVTDMFYEDGLGLTGKIEGKTIRVGNRKFMDAYGIYGLSEDSIDQKARKKGAFIVYTAIDDEVCGMFAVKYNAVDPDIDECIYNLVRSGITVAVKTNDPNVTPELIGKVYDIPSEYIVIMPAHIVEHYDKITSPAKNGDSLIAYNNNVSVFASIIIACKKLRSRIQISVIMQTILTFVGFGGCLINAVTGDKFNIVCPVNIILFQLISAIIVLGIPAIIKRIR